MTTDGQAVRELIPIERISEARIREALLAQPDLARWSRGGRGIPPVRLARIIRHRIWSAHDLSVAELRRHLLSSGKGRAITYWVSLEVDASETVALTSRTTFESVPSRRMTARLALVVNERPIEISSCILMVEPS
jgi:hypothetical protein